MPLRSRISLLAASAVFFLLTAWFARPTAGQWNSPDETANAFWSARVATGQSLVVRDVVVGLAHGAVHPRSFAVMGDALAPGSFPGILFLYGMAEGFLHLPVWLLTPLLTALAALALSRALRPLFGERVAFWSAILFLAHPAVVYYATRGLFNNLLCIDLLIFAAYALAAKPFARMREGRVDFDVIAAGGLFGLAMCTRLSEAVWATPLFLVLAWRVGPHPLRRFAWIIVGAALPLFLLLQFNAAIYGSPFRTGYVIPTPAAVSSVEGTIASSSFALPFGMAPRLALHNAWHYGLLSFWWISIPSVIGILLWFRRRDRKEGLYIAAAVFASVWLVIFYGSLRVQDYWDPTRVTIGTSYVRYFLPAYVLMLPFAAQALIALGEKIRAPKWSITACAVIIAALTINIAVFTGDESLGAVRRTLAENAAKKPLLLAAIPNGSVVLTARFDKVLFPDRLRIVPIFDPASFDAVASLAAYVPVYYYGLDADPGEHALVESEAAKRSLVMEPIAAPWPGETLFRLSHD